MRLFKFSHLCRAEWAYKGAQMLADYIWGPKKGAMRLQVQQIVMAGAFC
jgi:hypothetical protein